MVAIKRVGKQKCFSDISIGFFFEFDDDVCVKTSSIEYIDYDEDDGTCHIRTIDGDTAVEPIDVEIKLLYKPSF